MIPVLLQKDRRQKQNLWKLLSQLAWYIHQCTTKRHCLKRGGSQGPTLKVVPWCRALVISTLTHMPVHVYLCLNMCMHTNKYNPRNWEDQAWISWMWNWPELYYKILSQKCFFKRQFNVIIPFCWAVIPTLGHVLLSCYMSVLLCVQFYIPRACYVRNKKTYLCLSKMSKFIE